MIPKFRTIMIGIFCMMALGCMKSNDPQSVLNDYFNIMETFIVKMENLDQAEGVAEAMNQFSGQMKAMAPRIDSMLKNFPDINNLKGDVPGKYRELSKKNEEMARRFLVAMTRTLPYMEHSKVKKAQKRFEKVLGMML